MWTNNGSALRHRLGWRQADLALRCGMSQAAVSRVERGVLAGGSFGDVERMVVALGGELDVRVRWRGEELDRLLDKTHAAIGEALVRILTGFGWECAIEVTFAIRGEQGAVDLLAWHPPSGRLLIIENKSVVPDMQRMLSSLDRKARLGREIAAGRGWRATGVARAIVLTGTAANRARAKRFGATLAAVLPQDGRALRRWLGEPGGPNPAALWFLTDSQVMTAIKRRRVRRASIAAPESGPKGPVSVGEGSPERSSRAPNSEAGRGVR
jgi:transcriptional regulator with XRE-family HTH domain